MQQQMVEFMPALKKYFTTWSFQGRASRSEYWWPALAVFLLSFVPIVGFVVGLAAIVPGICCFVRRMHDIGRSGWWFWLCLIPLLGAIVLLVFTVSKSQEQENAYGPVPNVAD